MKSQYQVLQLGQLAPHLSQGTWASLLASICAPVLTSLEASLKPPFSPTPIGPREGWLT